MVLHLNKKSPFLKDYAEGTSCLSNQSLLPMFALPMDRGKLFLQEAMPLCHKNTTSIAQPVTLNLSQRKRQIAFPNLVLDYFVNS
jgi:hypothetical protein